MNAYQNFVFIPIYCYFPAGSAGIRQGLQIAGGTGGQNIQLVRSVAGAGGAGQAGTTFLLTGQQQQQVTAAGDKKTVVSTPGKPGSAPVYARIINTPGGQNIRLAAVRGQQGIQMIQVPQQQIQQQQQQTEQDSSNSGQ